MNLEKVEIKKLPKYGSFLQQEFVPLPEPIEIFVEIVGNVSGLVQPTTYNKLGLPEQLEYVIQLSEPEKETATIGGGGAYTETVYAPFFKGNAQEGVLKIQRSKGYMHYGKIIPIECWDIDIM